MVADLAGHGGNDVPLWGATSASCLQRDGYVGTITIAIAVRRRKVQCSGGNSGLLVDILERPARLGDYGIEGGGEVDSVKEGQGLDFVAGDELLDVFEVEDETVVAAPVSGVAVAFQREGAVVADSVNGNWALWGGVLGLWEGPGGLQAACHPQ